MHSFHSVSSRPLACAVLVVGLWLIGWCAPAFSSSEPSDLASPASFPVVPSHLAFSHIAPHDVEVLGHINAIVMDAEGFMWFGGASGLARYDGYDLKIFRHHHQNPRSLSSDNVSRLLVDRRGHLWVATESGLSLYHSDTQDFTVYRIASDQRDAVALNAVRALRQDSRGRLWLGTSGGLVLFDADSGHFEHHSFDAWLPESAHNTSLWAIAEDRQGALWLGSQSLGLLRYHPDLEEFTRFQADPSRPDGLSDYDVRTVLVDRDNRVWVGTYDGVVSRLDRDSGGFVAYRHQPGVRTDVIWDLLEDHEGRLWVGDGGGVNLLLEHKGVLVRYGHDEMQPSSPGNYAVRCLYLDAASDLWLGFFPSGVDRLDRQASAFRNYRHNPLQTNTLSNGGVLAVREDPLGNLWIGTGFGLNYFDRQTQQFTQYRHHPEDSQSLSGNTSLSLVLEDPHVLWVGAWSRGVNRMDLRSGRVQRYAYEPENTRSLLGVEPWSMIRDRRGDLWVATDMGISRYNRATDDFTRFLPTQEQMGGDTRLYSRVIYEDRRGTLWVGSDRGLFVLDPDSGVFTLHHHDAENPHSLSNDFVLSLLETGDGQFWVGTHGGGLNRFDRDTGQFQALREANGLPDDVVTSLVEDTEGALWVTTQRGIARLDAQRERFQAFDRRNGLLDNLFNRNATLLTRNGDLFFGSAKGFTLINPQDLLVNRFVPPVVITDVQVFNQSLPVGTEGSPLKIAPNHTQRLTLNHRQSVFSFEFAALSYALPEHNQYAYRLLGFDRQWHHVGNRRSATYTNLNPGHYVFQVKAANSDGIWNEQGYSIDLRILPPPWRTGWAYALYAVLLLAVVAFLVRHQLKQLELRQQKKINARLRKLDKIKDAFLANTSHELRTPLNGMIGMAELLLDEEGSSMSRGAVAKLELIRASGRRLANMVNDILDYAKLTERSLDMRLAPVRVYPLVCEVISLLKPLADAKHLPLHNAVVDDDTWVMADSNRLQQILINLLGNAIKFTDRGHIRIASEVARCYVTPDVEDTGYGIKPEDIHSLFVAFHQLHGNSPENTGTGLGLAITKQLVDLQGGEIRVHSDYGQGSRFSVLLPQAFHPPSVGSWENTGSWENVGAWKNASNDVHTDALVASLRGTLPLSTQGDAVPDALLDNPGQYQLLIVDDDPVNRLVLRAQLEQSGYRVREAANGPEALDIVGRETVDLMILDVMMPRMSGIDVCEIVRQTHRMDELPILFLTAYKTEEEMQRGRVAGGNEFLLKPVPKAELQARIVRHLRRKPSGH